jgi:hypothetical protein
VQRGIVAVRHLDRRRPIGSDDPRTLWRRGNVNLSRPEGRLEPFRLGQITPNREVSPEACRLDADAIREAEERAQAMVLRTDAVTLRLDIATGSDHALEAAPCFGVDRLPVSLADQRLLAELDRGPSGPCVQFVLDQLHHEIDE